MGSAPVGVDIETVEGRTAEMWQKLLGNDGYLLAQRVSTELTEDFDTSTTHVWTLLEAGKKANNLTRIVPAFDNSLGGAWATFSASINETSVEFITTVVETNDQPDRRICICAAMAKTNKEVGDGMLMELPSKPCSNSINSLPKFASKNAKFAELIPEMNSVLQEFVRIVENDTEDPSILEEHFVQFSRWHERTIETFVKLAEDMPLRLLHTLQHQVQEALRPFIQISSAANRALEKPLGYPGDYLLMNMIMNNSVTTHGIGYHFDRRFLSYLGSEAVRQCIRWVVDRVKIVLYENKSRDFSLLDIGSGLMVIESMLVYHISPG